MTPWLVQRYTVIAPDLRGCGVSDRTETGSDRRLVAECVSNGVEPLGDGIIVCPTVTTPLEEMVGYHDPPARGLPVTEAAPPGQSEFGAIYAVTLR